MAIIGGDYGQTWILTDDSEEVSDLTAEEQRQFEQAQKKHEEICREIDRIKATRKK